MSEKSAPAVTAEPAVQPYIPASQSLPEITVKAFVLGFILAAVLAGANAYLGLKVGMTVSASIPAAVVSMAILRFFRESNILENNIVQTIASAGSSLSAGVIFTLPGLILLNYWQGFPFIATFVIAFVGGILGIFFSIPLRRALVLEAGLKFPEGLATGEVLKAGSMGGQGVKAIAAAGFAAAFLKLCQTGFKIAASPVTGAVSAGRSIFGIGLDLGPALLAVGYIVGLDIGTVILAGGIISWIFAIPIFMAVADPVTVQSIVGDATGYDAAGAVWSARIRFLGVGAMAVGGFWALIELVKPITAGIRSSVAAMRSARAGGRAEIPRTERDIPFNIVILCTIALAVPLFLAFIFIIDRGELGISTGLYAGTILLSFVFALVAGFIFSSVAGYMSGLVGSSNNPISGVTIATILAISLILLAVLGLQVDFSIDVGRATSAAATAILVGAVVCCAAAISGDNLQDLKAGQIVGATPWKQQVMLMVGVFASALVISPVLDLLFQAYGLGGILPRAGMDESEMLNAPQATLMSSVANGVFLRNLPWTMIGIGAVLAVAVIVIDKMLEARGSTFRAPVLAVAVGIYLPIDVTAPIFVGGLVAWAAGRHMARRQAERGLEIGEIHQKDTGRGVLFASGLITGEALMGIVLAIPFALAESTSVLAVPFDALGIAPGAVSLITTTIGIAAYAGFIVWLYRVARGD